MTVPSTYVLFSGHLKVQLLCRSIVRLRHHLADLTAVSLDGNFTKSTRTPIDMEPSRSNSPLTGQLTIDCGFIDFPGRVRLRLVIGDEQLTVEGHVFDVTWPRVTLVLPQSHVTLSSDLVIRVYVRDVLCESSPTPTPTSPSSSSFSSSQFLLELIYLGPNPDSPLTTPHSPSPVVVYSHPIRTLSALLSLDIIVPCGLIDQAGLYQAALRSTDHPIAASDRMSASWSPAYNLVPVSGPSVFPCDEIAHLAVRYTQPRCYSRQDKVRLYRQVQRARGSIASPVDLAYVAERRADALGNVVRFPCEVLDREAIGYCFKYVSTANSGSVREEKMLCLPARGDTGETTSRL